MSPAELVQTVLTYDGPLLLLLLWWMVARARRRDKLQVVLEEIGALKQTLDEQKRRETNALTTTLLRIDQVSEKVSQQNTAITRIRASANLSEHLDVLEKVFLVSEHLDKLKLQIDQALQEFVVKEKSQHQEKAREAHAQFKQQIEQARKGLERTIAERLGHHLPQKDADECGGALVNSLRHTLLTVARFHQESVQNFAKTSAELLQTSVGEASASLRTKIDELKKRLDEAPLMLAGVKETD